MLFEVFIMMKAFAFIWFLISYSLELYVAMELAQYCCLALEKLRRCVCVGLPWLPAAWQQEAPSDVSRESCSSPGLRASWSPAMPNTSWRDSRRSPSCLFRWELSAGASWSLQTSQNRAAVSLPQFSVQDEWAFFWTAELQIPLLAKQWWWVVWRGEERVAQWIKYW